MIILDKLDNTNLLREFYLRELLREYISQAQTWKPPGQFFLECCIFYFKIVYFKE